MNENGSSVIFEPDKLTVTEQMGEEEDGEEEYEYDYEEDYEDEIDDYANIKSFLDVS